MLVKIINEETKEVSVGLEDFKEFYLQNGFKEMPDEDLEKAYNGIWYIKGYAPEKSLDELKTEKRAEINAARDNAEQGGFEYMGKVFDSDVVSCIRIQGAAQSMQVASMGEEVPTITWTTQDNSTIELTAQELLGLSVALATWSNICHQKATALKSKIEDAKTAEELELIAWENTPATLL